jgi:hypothetical protein
MPLEKDELNASKAFSLDDSLLSERKLLEQWPMLSRLELICARKQKRITWVKGKRGSAGVVSTICYPDLHFLVQGA